MLVAAAGILAILTAASMFLLWPREAVPRDLLEMAGFIQVTYGGRVRTVGEGPCEGAAQGNLRCRTVEFEVLEGPDRGRRFSTEMPITAGTPALAPGDEVLLGHQENVPREFEYVFLDRQRKPVLFWLAALFALSVVLLGRVRGVAALGGLAATFIVLLQFVLPAILLGKSPVQVATVGASAIAFASLYLAHGFGPKTTVALIGTLASLGLTAVLGTVFVDLAGFSGLASEEALFLNLGAGQVDLRGLILAGVVLGALGALDDMTVTQASAVWELRAADPLMTVRGLRRAGLRIGRDHVSSTVNTLVLAYAGASLPLLLLFILSDQSLSTVANSEVVAIEILRTLVGTIGLVAAVPITTWLAAYARPPVANEEPHTPPPVAAKEEPTPAASPPTEPAAPSEEEGLWLPQRRRDAWRSRKR